MNERDIPKNYFKPKPSRDCKWTMRLRIWGKVQDVHVRVDRDGTVRVWDPTTQHFTDQHGLSVAQETRIRRIWKQGT